MFTSFPEVSARFVAEVHSGDTPYPALQIVELTPHDDTGEVTTKATVRNQRGELVLSGKHTYLLRRQ